jgi:hypothetical protein
MYKTVRKKPNSVYPQYGWGFIHRGSNNPQPAALGMAVPVDTPLACGGIFHQAAFATPATV